MPIATNSYESINQDYQNTLDWIKSLGVHIVSGRTEHYSKTLKYWIEVYQTASEKEGKEVFPDFVSSMFEIMDFIDIYKALKNVPISELSSIAEKLQKGVNGPINSFDESNKTSTARNFIFEALVAARFHRPENSINTIFDSPSDTGIKIGNKKIWIECKRVSSLNNLEANIRKACNQIESNINHKISSGHRGLVAIDFTKVLQSGDKILVKRNDEELLQSISNIIETFIRQYSNQWEKIYKHKNKKIIGTLLRFATMASSEERNLIVRVSDWGVNPKIGIKSSDEELLRCLTQALN